MPHSRLDRLLANWPLAGMVAVVDCDSLVGDLQAAMRAKGSWRGHVVFGEAPAPSAVVDAIIGGATDYLPWPCGSDELAGRMEAWVFRSGEIRRRVEDKRRARQLLARLTKRELQVLKLVAEGMTSAEIAALLRLSSKTVEIHRYRLLKKLDLKGTAKPVRLVFEAQF